MYSLIFFLCFIIVNNINPETNNPETSSELNGLDEYVRSTFLTNAGINDSSSGSVEKENIITQLRDYFLSEKPLPISTDIMQFWSANIKKHPIPYCLSQILFAVPATEVTVEQLFSFLKYIFNDK